MKFDSQGSGGIFRPCQEKAGQRPSWWAAALDRVLEPKFRRPELLGARSLVWLLRKQPLRFSDLLKFHKSSGGAVSLAQQSVLPSIPQIWINHSV